MMNPRMAAGNKNLIKFFQRLSGSNLAEQQQNQQDDQNHAREAHGGMPAAVAIAAEPAGEAAEEKYDQNNDEYRSKRHGALPQAPRESPKTLPQPGSKHIPGRESLVDAPKRGVRASLLPLWE